MRMRPCSLKLDLSIGLFLSLGGLLARLPYVALIPVFNDEVQEAVYALSIKPGRFMPLVNVDLYNGPMFSYLLAASLRVFPSPVTPRVVVMLMGALTVGVAYWLARALGLSRPWAALVGLLMLATPHHVLVNSHTASTSYILPLFSTAFLLALALAVRRTSGPWLVAAGALVGLAGQAHPVIALMLPGVGAWFLTRWKSTIGLRTRWPYLAGIAFLAIYAPLIIFNLQSPLQSVHEAVGARPYIWQPDPSRETYVHNLGQLALQLGRQVSGVLEGDRSFRGLLGMPLLYITWAVAGLMYAARRGLTLPALAVGSQALVMPWVSNYYGMLAITRYTSQLMPLIFVAMSVLAAGMWSVAFQRASSLTPAISQVGLAPDGEKEARSASLRGRRAIAGLAGLLLVALSLWPLLPLFRYYEHRIATGETNARYYAFWDEFARQWRGEKILVQDSLVGFISLDDPGEYNPTVYLLAVHGVPYDFMPLGRILERLATGQEDGRVTLILSDDDVHQVEIQSDLAAWDSPAILAVRRTKGYGVHTIADARRVRKPAFVFADARLSPPTHAVRVSFADGLDMIGYEVRPDKVVPGGSLVVNIHWQAAGATSKAYTAFLHLVGPDGHLIAQDDHELGRGMYRTFFWKPGEVIRERYALALPERAAEGDYALRSGVYSFPSLKRLAVRSTSLTAQDDAVTLDTIHVGR